jgi:hypothetical protein
VTTLNWAILFTICNTDVRDKVQQEIDSLGLSDNQLVTMTHKTQMPYTQAVLNVCVQEGLGGGGRGYVRKRYNCNAVIVYRKYNVLVIFYRLI